MTTETDFDQEFDVDRIIWSGKENERKQRTTNANN
jgi:hypothetical protein